VSDSGDSYSRMNFAGVSAGAQNFGQAAQQLMSELDDLEGKLKTKLAQWEDTAKDAYHQYQQQWHQSAVHMQTIVKQLGVALSDSHDNTQSAVKHGVSQWS
jgi:ESAT-6 family protein